MKYCTADVMVRYSQVPFSASFSSSPTAHNIFLRLQGLLWQYWVLGLWALQVSLSDGSPSPCTYSTLVWMSGLFFRSDTVPSYCRYWVFSLKFPILNLKYNSELPQGSMRVHVFVYVIEFSPWYCSPCQCANKVRILAHAEIQSIMLYLIMIQFACCTYLTVNTTAF